MAITEAELSTLIKSALDRDSNDPDANPNQARQNLANDLASAIRQYVEGRSVSVLGVQSGGGTASGTIIGT